MNYIASISNHCPGKFLVCKNPVEDFNDGSILTVNPGEQAIFVNNGVICGHFENGRFELTTQNYPFINSFRRFLANGQLTYHCSIFYISNTQSCEILWGFPLPVRDPVQNIYTKIFVRGSYMVRVNDGEKLLLQLLGMNVNFMVAEDIKRFFGNRFQQHISNILAQYIQQSGREVLDLCTDNLAISEHIGPKLAEIVAPSGIEVSNFAISAMEIDVSDPNRRILEQAYAKSRERDILGDQYAVIKDTDIRTNASQTPFSGISFHPNNSPEQSSKVAQEKMPNIAKGEDYLTKLQQLQSMLQLNLITQSEFDELKSRILQKMI